MRTICWTPDAEVKFKRNGDGKLGCPCCPGPGQNIDVIISGLFACPLISFTGIDGAYTAVWVGAAGNWQVTVGTVTDTVQTNDAVLVIYCIGGKWYAQIAGFGSLRLMYTSFDLTSFAGAALGEPMPDLNSFADCGFGSGQLVYGYGATITLSLAA